ncbi:hypothetical protein SELMODRAFT_427965 [Selaginella moellendorffii]|uniref:Uncharacterized protein n=1 Tax=Selaginella moellendorffii TaxID=88036 RepID=D8T197_SELML|nr:hypothetical protein SELMODRAFT_427965 [Selaginella moellendorffii]
MDEATRKEKERRTEERRKLERSHNWEDGTDPWEDELFYNERIRNLSKRVTKEHIDVLRVNANPDHIRILQECYKQLEAEFGPKAKRKPLGETSSDNLNLAINLAMRVMKTLAILLLALAFSFNCCEADATCDSINGIVRYCNFPGRGSHKSL